MVTIYKYPLNEFTIPNVIEIPAGAEFLHCGFDPNEQMAVWAKVDTARPPKRYNFWILGTGWDNTDILTNVNNRYIGTFNDGPFVWHIYYGESK